MDQRVQFIALVQQDERTPFATLCARFGISRKTGYKWLQRYNEAGPAALTDRRSTPQRMPSATHQGVVAEVLALRRAHPSWGPKKLRAFLLAHRPDQHWPAASTVGDLLKRYGLIVPRRRRVRWTQPTTDRTAPLGPNETWCVDFKGDFLLGDGTRCYPLTVTDLATRYVLSIHVFSSINTDAVIAHFRELFARYGMPTRIRSDNGTPFATQAPGGLSRLSIDWMKLGIALERIEPGHPEQNGAHERMHRTLKAEATRPASHDRCAQQLRFDRFRHEYNTLRPHEALNQTPPAQHYTPSARMLPAAPGSFSYPDFDRVLIVCKGGRITLRGQNVRVHRELVGSRIGLRMNVDQNWEVWFGTHQLGVVDTSQKRLRLAPVR